MTRSRATRIAEFLGRMSLLGRLRLRTRFFAFVLASVLVAGGVNSLLLDTVVRRVLSNEVESHASALARRLADDVARSILREEIQSLRASLSAMTRVRDGVDYALVVTRRGDVLASSFSGGVPRGLAGANAPANNQLGSVLVADRSVVYRDVAVPILSGELGYVRLGMRLDHVEAGLHTIRIAIWAMLVAFLAAGLVGAYVTAEVINAPIERLVAFARSFDPARPDDVVEPGPAVRGELGDLIVGVDGMAQRLRQLHADREAFQGRIVRAERLATVGALAAGIAHEVNNPLAGMRTCLQAIEREPEDLEQTRAYAAMMIEASRSIERTVRTLMDSASRSHPQISDVNLTELTERIVLLLRLRFRDAGVHLDVELASNLPPLRSDVGLLQQILLNLLLNAGDASPRASGVLLRVTAADERMVFEVLDRGSGIADEVRGRIFDPFVTTKEHTGGTGLGLAMVHSLVVELDGSIMFESRDGGGTRFAVFLPIRSDEPAPEAPL